MYKLKTIILSNVKCGAVAKILNNRLAPRVDLPLATLREALLMTPIPLHNPNFVTGTRGLIAIDKIGNRVLFLDPLTYETQTTLDGFPTRVHELAIAPDRRTAYIPIYGDGKHGDNPHPGHLISVVDLVERRHVGDFSLSPYLAPHGLRWGPQGQLYCVCENSAVVLELEAATGRIKQVINVGSDNAHRMEVLPDGSKLYTETEEDAFVAVIDLQTRQPLRPITLPCALAGIGMSPDGQTIVLVDASEPRVHVVDTATDEITHSVVLEGHSKGAQIARYSPDGAYLVVTNHDEPLATIFDRSLKHQRLLKLGKGPMDMAFHADGKTVLIANHDEGTINVVDLVTARVLRTFPAGEGVETLSFF